MTHKQLIIASALVGIVALSACGARLPESRVEAEAPTTAAPAPTASHDIPDVPAPEPDLSCDWVDLDDTSTLVPDDWDRWCDGFTMSVEIYNDASGAELADLCSEFWATPDDELLDSFRFDYEVGRDEAIGAIDSMWVLCKDA